VGAALEGSLRRLRLDVIDCCLVHNPFAFPPGVACTTAARNDALYAGVSNLSQAVPGKWARAQDRRWITPG